LGSDERFHEGHLLEVEDSAVNSASRWRCSRGSPASDLEDAMKREWLPPLTKI